MGQGVVVVGGWSGGVGGGGASAIATDQEARAEAHNGRPKLKSNAFMMTGKKNRQNKQQLPKHI